MSDTLPSTRIVRTRMAGENHAVHTVVGRGDGYQRQPCATCPWRVDAVGEFPAEAFRHSADTAYDASMRIFACHTSGVRDTRVCAGFLLRNSANNIGARLGRMAGRIGEDVHDGGHELHGSYREMAIANGVGPDDPALAPCLGDDE